MSFFVNVLSTLPLIALLVVSGIFNVPRPYRHQQFAVPGIAVVYVLIVSMGLYAFNDSLDSMISTSVTIVPFLGEMYQTTWQYGIENAVIVFGFLVIKWLYRLFASRAFTGESFPGQSVVEVAYEYDGSRAHWFVRPSIGQTRSFFRALYVVSLILTGLMIMTINAFPTWPAFAAIAFPALAALLVGEIWHALNGVTRDEASDRFLGTDDDSQRITDYEVLRGALRTTFEDRILDEGTDLSQFSQSSPEPTSALRELAASEDRHERTYGAHFERLKQAGIQLDDNLVDASVGLLQGVSVVINTPFYRDVTPYLALPTFTKLLQGGRCLIITGRDGNAGELAQWMDEGLEEITGIPELWDVGVVGQRNPDTLEVGILRAADLHNLDLLAEHEYFFRDVETVILVEPSRMLAAGQLGLSLVVSMISHEQQPVFVSLDRSQDGLVDSLSHLLKVNLTSVIAMQQSTGADLDMIWQSEGPLLAPRLFPGVARYLGVGTEISAVAMKYHISEVTWVGGEKFPVVDMAWIAGQYYPQLGSYVGTRMSQRTLRETLVAETNPTGMQRTDSRFLVVEDELHNAYESLRLYASRSTEAGFANLISENYLLRDYMVDNRDVFSADGKAIPSFVPDFARSGRNTVMKLLLMMATFDVPCSMIQRELGLSNLTSEDHDSATKGNPEDAVIGTLESLVKEHFDVANLALKRTSRGVRNNGVDATYRLSSGSALQQIVGELRSVYFLVEDETEEKNFLGGCLRGHVAQTLLPGQFLTFDGKQYEVQTIGNGNHESEIVLRRAAEHISGRPIYRQLRTFTLQDLVQSTSISTSVENQLIRVERFSATIVGETHGYLELTSRDDFTDAKRVSVSGLEPRQYLSKTVLRLTLEGASEKVRQTIALLINELFVTVFPTAHHLIVAVTQDPKNEFADLLPGLNQPDGADDDAIYIFEDSLVDLGLTLTFERHSERLFEVITDYLAWLETEQINEPQSASAPVRFPDESDADVEEREARVSEYQDRGSYPTPEEAEEESSLFRRFPKLFRGRSKRKTAACPQAPGTAPTAASSTLTIMTERDEPEPAPEPEKLGGNQTDSATVAETQLGSTEPDDVQLVRAEGQDPMENSVVPPAGDVDIAHSATTVDLDDEDGHRDLSDTVAVDAASGDDESFDERGEGSDEK